MNTILVKTQSDIDALPASFSEYTQIEIHSDPSSMHPQENLSETPTKPRETSEAVTRALADVAKRNSELADYYTMEGILSRLAMRESGVEK